MPSDLCGIHAKGQWEEGFAALTTFKAREGHCLVTSLHVEGTFKLGGWVGKQRMNRDTMSAERKQRLDASDLCGIHTKVHGKKALQR